MKKQYLSILFLILFLSALISGCLESSIEEEGDDFIFNTLEGGTKQLIDYRGKIVILDLWATWCGPCQFQMTELKKIYENYSRADLEIISVDIDAREDIELIKSFRAYFNTSIGIDLNWIFGMDNNGSISEKYMKEGAIPTLCIFDKKGKLSFREAGVCVYKEIPESLPANTTVLAPIIDELNK